MVWSFAGAILFCGIAMWICDILSVISKARLPSLFMLSVIFMVGYWTVLPKDILDTANINIYVTFALHVILIHVGTLFDPQEVKKEWKTVLVTLAAVAGIVLLVFGVGQFVVGTGNAVAMAPPLAGGMMATIVVSQVGTPEIVTMAMLAMTMQGFVGFPLTVLAIKKEGGDILARYRRGELTTASGGVQGGEAAKPRLIDRIPQRFKTPYWYLCELLVLAYLAVKLSQLLNGLLNTNLITSSITCLLIGIVTNILGLIDREPVNKAQSSGFLTWTMTLYLMGLLANTTPQMLVSLILPLLFGLVAATVGIFLGSVLLGKALGFSKWFSFAIGLNCFLGFPTNFILVNEAVRAMTGDEAEQKALTEQIMPKMVIGSIVAVSLVSVLLAGVLLPMIQ